MPNGPDISGMSTARDGATKVFYLRTEMPNGPDVSGMSTARGGATKVFLLTNCNAECARCKQDEHGEGWGD